MANASEKSQVSEKQDQPLSADPEVCSSKVSYFSSTGGKWDHMLVNTGEQRLAVKIRCSDNQLYRVSPSCLFVDAGQAVNIEVTRSSGPQKRDKLIVQFTECSENETDPKAFYANLEKGKPQLHNIKILLRMNSDNKDMKKSYERIEEPQ